MSAINLGWVSLPVSPTLLLISVTIGAIVTLIYAQKHKGYAATALVSILLSGAVVGRVVYVLQFWDNDSTLWQIFDVSNGGINYLSALVASALVFFAQQRKSKQRKVLYSGLITTVGAYAIFSVVIAIARSHSALPETSFMQLNGQGVTIFDISQQRPVIVNLWASSCPPCKREMPMLTKAELVYRDVAFISLNQREPSEVVERFLTQERLTFEHVLLDSKGEIATNKGLFSLPVTLFFDTTGKLVHSHTGALTEKALQQRIEQYF